MEVTRKNFNDSLPLVSASIDKADFLVIDAEFTGLINGRDVSLFDTPQEYYTRLLNGSTDFLLIQYGLCAFHWDEEKKVFMNEAYNFYLFPRGRPGPEKIFLCQSSSLDFLAAQGFDFNKLIKEGISYMTEPEETKLREYLTERQKNYSNDKDKITIPAENKQQIEDICKQVRGFLNEKKSDEIEIDRCNAFVRRLLFQELGSRFKNEAFVETKVLENKNRVLKVTRITSQNDVKSRDTRRKDKEWEEFEDAVGFSKVARLISQSEKLVVGHNMLLDVMHTLSHFFHPLPADYASFKEFTHCMFPKLLDTKYMSSLPQLKDKVNSSVLEHLFKTLSEPPFAMPKTGCESGRGYSEAQVKLHEAGYDAYVTGLCFLAMRAQVDPAPLEPILNKLFLAKTAHQDSPYINLVGQDPSPSREHVFHMTFPKEWQRNDINTLFSPFGPILVQFLDDVSAVVSLSRRDRAKDVLKALGGGGPATIVPYVKYRQTLTKFPEAYSHITDTPCACRPAEPAPRVRPPSPARGAARSRTSLIGTRDAAAPPAAPVSASGAAGSVAAQAKLQPGRGRANSESGQPPPRKRTSSGLFVVEETEPPPKKTDIVRSNSEGTRKKPEIVSNGRRKTKSDTKKTDTEKEVEVKESSVVEKFDEDAKNNCVTAFKESESWD